jgi:hypothetical protein
MTGARLVFAVTIFLSAFLLFQIQLIVGKLVLPWFGGTPAVWTTCMLVFQSLLVLGYAYAHLVVAKLAPARQRTVHVAVLALAVIVLGVQVIAWGAVVLPPASWKPTGSVAPASEIVQLLAASVAFAFLVLSATGPLLQGWFARTHPGMSPYRLYALSNLGSLLGLLTYPVVFEPLLPVRMQAAVWAMGFVAFAGLCAWCASRVPARAESRPDVVMPADDHPEGRPSWSLAVLWLALAGCASMLLLATTNQVSQDVAVVPFLWVLPLCLYLLSLIVCFEWEHGYRRAPFVWALGAGLAGACVVLHRGLEVKVPLQVAAYSAMLFVACMVCHGELVRLKPGRRHLTAFYLMVSIGGALGGVFVGVVAPAVFTGFWELHLSMTLVAVLTVLVLWRDRASWIHHGVPWPSAVALVGAVALMRYLSGADLLGSNASRGVTPFEGVVVVAMAAWLAPGWVVRRWRVPGARAVAMLTLSGAVVVFALLLRQHAASESGQALVRSRSFYGVLAVLEEDVWDPDEHAYRLQHGRITHGVQFQGDGRRTLATTYYGENSGVGLAILHHPRHTQSDAMRIGVIGLGVGTLAAHARPEDYVRFYEINPAVIALSQGEGALFSYLSDSPARVDVVAGDARISLERELEAGRPQAFDVLAIDAFSSDSLPVHLLTREAMAVYLRHLRDGRGIVAFHISNRYLDLRPVVWALADQFQLTGAHVEGSDDEDSVWKSTWILLSRDAAVLAQPEIAAATTARNVKRKPRLWTDDYSDLFRVLKW